VHVQGDSCSSRISSARRAPTHSALNCIGKGTRSNVTALPRCPTTTARITGWVSPYRRVSFQFSLTNQRFRNVQVLTTIV
jgi:hypothetical protein